MKTFARVSIVIVKLRFANELFLPTSDSLLFGICKQLVVQHGADFLSLDDVSANSYFVNFTITISHTNTSRNSASNMKGEDCILY